MKKVLLMVVAAIMAMGANAQNSVKKVLVYEGNSVAYERIYDAVDSVVFVEEAMPEEALPCKFSISATQQVYFSKGNLQATFNESKWTWAFAEHQWDYIGNAVANSAISGQGWASANGTVDLYGWSTQSNYLGIYNSIEYNDYSGDFQDWGDIKDSYWIWRTLTKDEWMYLFHGRTNAEILFGYGTINDIRGLIILPDNWTTPNGVFFCPTAKTDLTWDSSSNAYHTETGASFTINAYTIEEWSKMEAAGAVFLPAAGDREGTTVTGDGISGYYWSATPYDNFNAHYFFFGKYDLASSHMPRYEGYAVRLVIEIP